MSTWKIYTSTTESLMNETTNYKNGLLSQEIFNQKMLLNLSYLIYALNKEKVSQKESNPTLDFFLPVSQLSYTMESQLNNKTAEPVSNEVEKEEMFRLSSTDKDDMKFNLKNLQLFLSQITMTQLRQTHSKKYLILMIITGIVQITFA